MADTKISALTALTGAGIASGDLIPIVDVSATATKSMTAAELVIGLNALGLANLTTNTFTGLQTITQASANAGIIASTGYSLTGSDATSMLNFAGATNSTGNAIMFRIAISNTAWGASGKFLSFLAGASGTTEVLSVTKAGLLTSASSITATGFSTGAATMVLSASSNQRVAIDNLTFRVTSGMVIGFSSTSDPTLSPDTGIARNAAGVVEVNSGTAGTLRDFKMRNVVGQTGYHEMVEMTAPSAGASDTVRIYAVDNGAGKTQLMALFSSGAAQQIAIQP